MKKVLFDALVEKGAITNGTELLILRQGRSLGDGRAIAVKELIEVTESYIKDDITYLNGFSNVNGVDFQNIASNHILEIDGMDISRFAKVFGLKDDGSVRPKGKKRGRKPKIKPEE